MIVRILGSAAGGGFPQWNCNCRNCAGVRAGTLRARPRTQSSIALSTDGTEWLLCNASPDIHRQLAASLPQDPHGPLRSSPVAATLLVDGQIDHALGLLLMREHRAPLQIWTTPAVHSDLTGALPILTILEHYAGVDWRTIPVAGEAFTVPAITGLTIRAVAVPGKPGPYSPHRHQPRPGDNIALIFRANDTGRQLLYAPGLAAVDAEMATLLAASDCVLVDGTCFHDDDLIRIGASTKTARDMGHLPQAGAGGMIEALGRLPPTVRRILTHINNTNPILDENSAERAQLDRAGIEVAYDGMEIAL